MIVAKLYIKSIILELWMYGHNCGYTHNPGPSLGARNKKEEGAAVEFDKTMGAIYHDEEILAVQFPAVIKKRHQHLFT